MKKNKGFTLTEILLAVMIVGIIGVALASLTTAASRESGVGRSRIVLHHQLSMALRQIRQDVQESSRLLYVHGGIDDGETGQIPLLLLAKNVSLSGEPIFPFQPISYVLYCFSPGSITSVANGGPVQPAGGATDGGTITRQELSEEPSWSGVDPQCGGGSTLLQNVKFISHRVNYMVPMFRIRESMYKYSIKDSTQDGSRAKNLGSVLQFRLIVEIPSSPVINEVVEELFALPHGYADNRN